MFRRTLKFRNWGWVVLSPAAWWSIRVRQVSHETRALHTLLGALNVASHPRIETADRSGARFRFGVRVTSPPEAGARILAPVVAAGTSLPANTILQWGRK
jgi:hypothetical protein